MDKQIRIDLQHGDKGIGYRINPETKTYTLAPLQDGELKTDGDSAQTGEYSDPKKFAKEIFFLVLASLNDGSSGNS